MRDYNETRPSDIVVVNFGGHYHDIPEDDEKFKQDVFPILDDLAELGKNVTAIWRCVCGVRVHRVRLRVCERMCACAYLRGDATSVFLCHMLRY